MYPIWYTMLTEVLCCVPCTKAARSGEGGKMCRWLAWDSAIMCQLGEAHQAMFPAILTDKRRVDKNVVRLLWDRTEHTSDTLLRLHLLRESCFLPVCSVMPSCRQRPTMYGTPILSNFGTVLKMNSTKKDGLSPEEEVVEPGQPDPVEDDEAYQSDTEATDDVVASVPAHITLPLMRPL
ncbi:hypothetical protein PHYPO_G00225340 [Pangasianodon hypophthalmus]|uniref:DUF6729 domain-containing protein n=1 Tax=Pangasianodon hypophthalmus TaxID=310915 RepID=A0A5N5NVK7_PANHP|nr:hypothetical protein PHYPO_G00225340 [Pangasianodon hypophthalmus]